MRPAGNRRPHPTVNTQSGRISGDRQEPRARNPTVHRIHALRPPARNRHCGRMDSALAGTDDARRRPGCTAGVRRSACAAFAPWLDDPPGQRAGSRPVLRAAAFLAAPKSSDVPHVQRENRYRGKTVSRGSWKTWQRAASSLRVSATRRFTQFERWSPCPAGSERRSWRGYPTRRLAKQPYAKGQCECAQEHLRRRLVRRRRCHSTYPRCQRSSTDYRNEQRTCQWVFDLSSTRHRGRRDALHARPWLPVQSIFVQRHRNPAVAKPFPPPCLHGLSHGLPWPSP